jgi:hypothetical protein
VKRKLSQQPAFTSVFKEISIMEAFFHRFSELFSHLGLRSDNVGIQQFIEDHSPLDPSIRLEDAPFWTPAQATFLKEELLEDADWAEVVDQLNNALRPVPSGTP